MSLLLTNQASDSVSHQSHYFHNLMQQAVGTWQSNRTYESVKTGKVIQVSSSFEVTLNEKEKALLAELHHLPTNTFPYLVQVAWRSQDIKTGQELSEGKMLMGYHEGLLYRDRGYVTDNPVASEVMLYSPNHMLIRTYYEGVTALGDETVAYEENFRYASDRRLRSVLAWDKDHNLSLLGQYMERKVA